MKGAMSHATNVSGVTFVTSSAYKFNVIVAFGLLATPKGCHANIKTPKKI
jgi:hypothetical protein